MNQELWRNIQMENKNLVPLLLVLLVTRIGEINAAGAAPCNASTAIIIQQQDLQFSHPLSSVSVSVSPACPCHVMDIVASCGSVWDQNLVDSAYVMVNAQFHTCKLLSGQMLRPLSAPVSFVYQHSPPLTDLVAISATFSACDATGAASETPVSITYGTNGSSPPPLDLTKITYVLYLLVIALYCGVL